MRNNIKQAVILSAGLGTRLRSIAKDIPKVMVPLADKPLLQFHIEQMKKFGVAEFFINLFYLPDVIKNHFGDGSKFGVKINYVLEGPEIRGTAGGIKNFDGLLGQDFFVIYGDTFYEVDYGRIADFYFSRAKAIGIGTVRKTDHPWDSDLAVVGDDGRVIEFLIKPHSKKLFNRLNLSKENLKKDDQKISASVRAPVRVSPCLWGMSSPYIFSKKILEYIPEGKYYEIDHQLVPDLLSRNYKYYAYQLGEEEFRKDIGTPERYKEVQDYLEKLS